MDENDTVRALRRTPFGELYGDGFGWWTISPEGLGVKIIPLDVDRVRQTLSKHGWEFDEFKKKILEVQKNEQSKLY